MLAAFRVRKEVPILLGGLFFLQWYVPPRVYNGRARSFNRASITFGKPVATKMN
jgi:hypothetical protein